MKIKIKKLSTTAKLPTRESESAAGYDLYADIIGTESVMPHQVAKIPTNIAIEIPDGFFGAIYARSGTATKKGLRPANCVGIVDADYRGSIFVPLRNDTSTVQNIEPNERIAQIVIQQSFNVQFEETDELSETDRGDGGFGSTGK